MELLQMFVIGVILSILPFNGKKNWSAIGLARDKAAANGHLKNEILKGSQRSYFTDIVGVFVFFLNL